MRGKKARRLRRMAEAATVGKPERLPQMHPQRGYWQAGYDTTRGVYRAMKALVGHSSVGCSPHGGGQSG